MADEDPVTSALHMDRAPPLGNSLDVFARRALHVKVGNAPADPIPVAIISGGGNTPIRFRRNGASVEVTEDTGTPANDLPLPVKLMGTAGPINITAGDLNVHLSDQGVNFDRTRIGDGTYQWTMTSAGEGLVHDADALLVLNDISAFLDSLDDKIPAGLTVTAGRLLTDTTGTVAISGTVPVTQSGVWSVGRTWTLSNATDSVTAHQGGSWTVAANQSGVWTTARSWTLSSGTDSVAATQSGAWSVSVSSSALPTGAATEATLSTRASETNLTGLRGQIPTTLGQKTMANSLAVVLASDQSSVPVAATQSGVWSTGRTWALSSGTDSVTVGSSVLPTGAATEATLSALNAKHNADFGASSGAIRVAAQIGNATGSAAFGAGTTNAQTLRVVLPTDQTAIPATQSGVWTTGRTWNLASAADSVTAVGPAANGAAISGNPVRIAFSDGTNTRDGLSDSSGRQVMVGAGGVGTPLGGIVSVQGVSGGTPVPTDDIASSPTGSAVPNSAQLIGASDGTNLQALQGRTSLPASSLFGLVVRPIPFEPVAYSAARAFTFGSAPTDVFTLSGSASKVIRVRKISFTVTATNQGGYTVNILRRSTANTGGTSTAPTPVPHDSTSPAGTAVARFYTANPTALGTLVGNTKSYRMTVPATNPLGGVAMSPIQEIVFEFPFVLRGTGELLCINLGGVTLSGNLAAIYVAWSEE